MKILIVTDAWAPQMNGVVRTLQTVRGELEKTGCEVHVISPDLFRSMPCPSYGEIRLALTTSRRVGRMIEAIAPDSLHIATEGPLGMAARPGWLWRCRRRGAPGCRLVPVARAARRCGTTRRWPDRHRRRRRRCRPHGRR